MWKVLNEIGLKFCILIQAKNMFILELYMQNMIPQTNTFEGKGVYITPLSEPNEIMRKALLKF